MRRQQSDSIRTLANAHEAVQSAAKAVSIAADAIRTCADAMSLRKETNAIGFEVQQDAEDEAARG